MAFTEVSKNQMLTALTIDKVSLHNGDPGTAGTQNELSTSTDYSRQDVTWNTVANSQKTNTADVVFEITGGEGNNSKITWVGLWANSTFKGKSSVTQVTFEVDGTYTLPKNTGIVLKLSDPT